MAGLQLETVDVVSDALHDCTVFSVEQHGYDLVIRARHKDTGEERAVRLSQQIGFGTTLIYAEAINA